MKKKAEQRKATGRLKGIMEQWGCLDSVVVVSLRGALVECQEAITQWRNSKAGYELLLQQKDQRAYEVKNLENALKDSQQLYDEAREKVAEFEASLQAMAEQLNALLGGKSIGERRHDHQFQVDHAQQALDKVEAERQQMAQVLASSKATLATLTKTHLTLEKEYGLALSEWQTRLAEKGFEDEGVWLQAMLSTEEVRHFQARLTSLKEDASGSQNFWN